MMSLPSSTDPTMPMPHATPFVGREPEVAALEASVTRMRSGRGQLALLVGEPGIGKTRLAEELAASADAHGVCVLWGQCYEWEGAPAYWPWVQVLRHLIEDLDTPTLASSVGLDAADIAQLVPELHTRLPALPPLPALEPEQARFRLIDSVTSFLLRRARIQPLLIVLDDLHWADTASLLLLQFLARELSRVSILVIGTYRSVEVGRQHPVARSLAELTGSPASQRIPLRGLPKPAITRYVAFATGTEPPAALVEAVVDKTDGNPFFVTEVVRLLQAEGRLGPTASASTWRHQVPESVRDVVGRRLDHLSAMCYQVLAMAAVSGREYSLQVLEVVSGQSAEQVLEVLDEARQAWLVEAGDSVGRYHFSHALIQETLYMELSTAQRVRLHRRVGEAIEQIHTRDLTPHYQELAYHYFQAVATGSVDKAITYAVRAAERATEQFALEEAVAQYRRALQALELKAPESEGEGSDRARADLLIALGKAHWRAGDPAAGKSAAEEVVQIARKLGCGELLAAGALVYAAGNTDLALSDQRALDLLAETIEVLGFADSPFRASVLARYVVSAENVAGLTESMKPFADEAVAIAQRLGDTRLLFDGLAAKWHSLNGIDDLAQRVELTAELLRVAELTGDRQSVRRAHHRRLIDLLQLGQYEAMRDEVGLLTQLLEEVPSPLTRYTVLNLSNVLALYAGRYDEVERVAPQALAIGKRAVPFAEHTYFGHLFVVRRAQGRLAEFEANFVHFTEETPSLAHDTYYRVLVALLHCELGRVDRARSELHDLAASEHKLSQHRMWLIKWALLSEVCFLMNDIELAPMFYDRLLPYEDRHVSSRSWGMIPYGSAAYYLGLLATVLARYDDADRHFEQALADNQRFGVRPYVTRTEYAYAELLVVRDQLGDQERALTLVDQALRGANEMGMTRLTEQATALAARIDAAAAGVVLRSSRVHAPYGLSPRELDVLRLLIEGRSSREIAETLFISPRTVSTHVTNVLGKLDVNSRAAAVAVALRHALV